MKIGSILKLSCPTAEYVVKYSPENPSLVASIYLRLLSVPSGIHNSVLSIYRRINVEIVGSVQ